MSFCPNQTVSEELEAIRNLELPIYNSTESLSFPIYDYSNVFLLPAICLFGILTSTLNIIVLVRTKLKEDVHLIMLIASVSDLSFLLTQVFIAVIRCGALCPYGYSYAANVYGSYVYLFVGYSIVTFSALVEVTVSIDRLLLLSNRGKSATGWRFSVRCLILLAVSVALLLPEQVLAREIIPMGAIERSYQDANNCSIRTYELLYKKTIKSSWLVPAIQIPMTILSVIKGPLLIGMVFLTNVMVVVKFKAYLDKKKKMTKSKLKPGPSLKAVSKAFHSSLYPLLAQLKR